MVGIFATFAIAILLAVPLIWVVRSERRLTWTGAVILGTVIGAIGILLIGELPSRLLYWFDANAERLAERPGLGFLAGDQYIRIRDVIVNSIQGALFVAMIALTYFWGERHRKAGRFKS